jgi:hypothetical protein|tara:strand:- start:657 stop:1094 length:438 start_codon:yes stop_codon:yes gene_type:complete
MKKILLFVTILVMTLNVNALSSSHILLQCSPSPSDKTFLLTISIDKTNQEANVESRVKGLVIDNVESLPVEFTENLIKITEEYSTEKLIEKKFPEGMAFTSQFRISRKSLAMNVYGRFGDAEFEYIESGDSVCELIQTDKLGNQI